MTRSHSLQSYPRTAQPPDAKRFPKKGPRHFPSRAITTTSRPSYLGTSVSGQRPGFLHLEVVFSFKSSSARPPTPESVIFSGG
jgi:hypothetical protein